MSMPESGENRSEAGQGSACRCSPDLANGVRLGLLALTAGGVIFSSATMLEIGIDEGLLCLLATSALVALTAPLALRRRDELIEPIWLVALIVAVGVTGKAFYICFGPRERVQFLLLDKAPHDLLFAALVMATGLVCLSVGYRLGAVRWRIPFLERLAAVPAWDPRRFTIVTGALLVCGLISFAVFAQRAGVSFDSLGDLSSPRTFHIPGSRFRGAAGYLRWGAMMTEIAFYLVLAHWAASRRRVWSRPGAAVLLFAMLALPFPVFVSTRLTVLIFVLRVIMIWICLRGEPKPRYVVAMVTAGLVTAGAMLALRSGASDWRTLRAHIGVSGLLEATVGGRHFLDLTKTAHILAAVPETVDYQYGRTMVTWLVAPVPRSWWPAKPAIGAGKELGPLLFQTNRNTGVPPGIVGELNLNFGLPGVYVGLFLVGVLLRSLYATLRPRFPNMSIVLIYTVLVTRLSTEMLANSVSGCIAKLVQEMIPLILALYLLARADRAEAVNAAIRSRVEVSSS